MRTILLAMLVAAGIGLAGTSGVSAAPVNGAVIDDLAKATDPVAQVQWGHWRGAAAGVIGDGAAAGGVIEIARLAATIGGEMGRPAQSGWTVEMSKSVAMAAGDQVRRPLTDVALTGI